MHGEMEFQMDDVQAIKDLSKPTVRYKWIYIWLTKNPVKNLINRYF